MLLLLLELLLYHIYIYTYIYKYIYILSYIYMALWWDIWDMRTEDFQPISIGESTSRQGRCDPLVLVEVLNAEQETLAAARLSSGQLCGGSSHLVVG